VADAQAWESARTEAGKSSAHRQHDDSQRQKGPSQRGCARDAHACPINKAPCIADHVRGPRPPRTSCRGHNLRRLRHVGRGEDAKHSSACLLRANAPATKALVVAELPAASNTPTLGGLTLHAGHDLPLIAVHALLFFTKPVSHGRLLRHVHHPLQRLGTKETEIVTVLASTLYPSHSHSVWAVCNLILSLGTSVPEPALASIV